MAKVTVYVSDDQLDQLKAVRGFGRGGVSKLFQAFLESATGGGGEPAGRYDYARKLMPLHAAIERHRRRLARSVQVGGPPADGGPVAAALTVLVYKRLLEQDPSLAAALDKEFSRFGLDELVAAELADVDITAEPTAEEEAEEVEDDGFDLLSPLGINLGNLGAMHEVRDALRTVGALKLNLRDLKSEAVRERTVRRSRTPGRGPGGRDLRIEVASDDDPRDVLSATDYAVFQSRHGDWEPGSKLSPSQMESVRDLLIRRAGGEDEAVAAPAPEGQEDSE